MMKLAERAVKLIELAVLISYYRQFYTGEGVRAKIYEFSRELWPDA